MNRKYELTITSDYVHDWTVVDAVRELFQNAIDQQTQNPDNKMSFNYNSDKHKLVIANKESMLTASSLLLGHTTKATDDAQIGQFGEGYKIASLVLLRLGYSMVFYNYKAREVWKPRMVTSKRYGGEKILTFFVDNAHVWEKVPDNDLTIVVYGIADDDYEKIKESNLYLQKSYKYLDTFSGQIMLDKQYAGNIYVSGLFVTHLDNMRYGYNMKPQCLKLGRDRSMVASFDILWETTRMILASSDESLVEDALEFDDTKYAKTINSCCMDVSKDVASELYDKFRDKYGKKAIPVSSQSEFDNIKHTYTDAEPVMVSEARSTFITSAPSYNIYCSKVKHVTTKSRMAGWFNKWSKCLPPKAIESFNDIMSEMKDE